MPITRTMFIAITGISGIAACGTLADDPTGERSFLPDRGIGPWRIAELEVCLGATCGEQAAAEIESIDLVRTGGGRVDNGGNIFGVVAGRTDGTLLFGDLERTSTGWRLKLGDQVAIMPSFGWHASGLKSPDFVFTASNGIVTDRRVLHGVGDGSAIGIAAPDTGWWASTATPLVRASDIGAATISQPSGVDFAGEAVLVFAATGLSGVGDALLLCHGPSWDHLGPAEVILAKDDIDSSLTGGSWGPISGFGDPDVGVTPDGLARIFFAATGSVTIGGDAQPTDSNSSIGYAATNDLGTFVPYANNPVYNRSYSFIFDADEHAPSVASDGDTMLLIYMEGRSGNEQPGATRPVIAEHTLGQ